MYDPKFTQKQMYDQYGSSRETTKNVTKSTRSSGYSGNNPNEDAAVTRGIGAKPPSFGGGQDNNPNRDEYENKPTVAKVYEKTVDLFKSFGAKEPEALIVDGKRVYQGPLFSGYDPTVRIGPFGGDAGKKQYRFGMPFLGEVSPSYPSPTLPSGDNNPALNMFGVRRGFTRGTDMPDLSVSPEAPANMDPMTRVLSQAMLPTEVNYTIQDGDTLSEIARDADTTVEELKELNNIENINEIDAGANLKVPVKAGKLTDTQAALRRGLDRPKDNQGVETAMSIVPSRVLSDATVVDTTGMSFLNFIAKGEGTYESSNRGTKNKKIIGSTGSTIRDGKKLSEMTIGEIKEKQKIKSTANTDRLFAVGKYQLIPDTLKEATKALNISDNAIFNAALQEQLGQYLIFDKRDPIGAYIRGESNDAKKALLEAAKEFASMPVPEGSKKGKSYYGSGNKAQHTLEEAQSALDKARTEYMSVRGMGAPSTSLRPKARPLGRP
jgi:LysM repeat protein